MEAETYKPLNANEPDGNNVGGSGYTEGNYNGYAGSGTHDPRFLSTDSNSQYSHFWNKSEAFEAHTFSRNSTENKKCNDLFFAIAFLIHLFISIVLFIVYGAKYSKKIDAINASFGDEIQDDITDGQLKIILGASFAIALVFNALHFVYALMFPKFYIRFGLVVGLGLSIFVGIVVCIAANTWAGMILPVISMIISAILYFWMRKHINTTTLVFNQTCRLIVRHPTVLLFALAGVIVSSLISSFFSALIYCVSEVDQSGYALTYLAFSFLWTCYTINYVVYMTIAGFAGTWYFLDGTPYYPSSPVWQSFKRASTTSFGSASAAGFLLALVTFVRMMAENTDSESSTGSVLRAIGLCLLRLLEAIVAAINKYGLIYCALFGVPYSEGSKRFVTLKSSKLCDTLIRSCCISSAVKYNMFTYSIVSGFFGYFVGYLAFKGVEDADMNDTLKYSLAGAAFIFTLILFAISTPILATISDTLLVCYLEAPERLKHLASDIHDVFQELRLSDNL